MGSWGIGVKDKIKKDIKSNSGYNEPIQMELIYDG